jgi:hypothetical protein
VKVWFASLKIVIGDLLKPVIVAITSWFVIVSFVKTIDDVMGVLSIQVTSACSSHVLPARSSKVKRNVSLLINVLEVVFKFVIVSSKPVIVAITS